MAPDESPGQRGRAPKKRNPPEPCVALARSRPARPSRGHSPNSLCVPWLLTGHAGQRLLEQALYVDADSCGCPRTDRHRLRPEKSPSSRPQPPVRQGNRRFLRLESRGDRPAPRHPAARQRGRARPVPRGRPNPRDTDVGVRVEPIACLGGESGESGEKPEVEAGPADVQSAFAIHRSAFSRYQSTVRRSPSSNSTRGV